MTSPTSNLKNRIGILVIKKKELIRTRNNFPYQIQKCNKQQYQESFVQMYLRKTESQYKSEEIKPTEEINFKILVSKQCNKVYKRSIWLEKCIYCNWTYGG